MLPILRPRWAPVLRLAVAALLPMPLTDPGGRASNSPAQIESTVMTLEADLDEGEAVDDGDVVAELSSEVKDLAGELSTLEGEAEAVAAVEELEVVVDEAIDEFEDALEEVDGDDDEDEDDEVEE